MHRASQLGVVVLALIVSAPLPASTSGSAPFCMVDNNGNAQCFYYSLDACRQAASYNHGMCGANIQPQQQLQVSTPAPPQPTDYSSIFPQHGMTPYEIYQATQQGFEQGRQRREQQEREQREKELYAQQKELIRLQQEQARVSLQQETPPAQTLPATPSHESLALPGTSVKGAVIPTVGDFMAGGKKYLAARSYLVNIGAWTMALVIAPQGRQVVCLPNSPALSREAYAAIFERQLAGMTDAEREAAKDRPVTDVLSQGLRQAYPCQ